MRVIPRGDRMPGVQAGACLPDFRYAKGRVMDLLERVELLERETAVLKRRASGWRAATGALVVIGLFASCRAAPPSGAQTPAPAANQPQKEISTQTLNVTDAQGRPRAALGVAENGSVVLAMMDRESKV